MKLTIGFMVLASLAWGQEPVDVPAIREWNGHWQTLAAESAPNQKTCESKPKKGGFYMVPGPWKYRWIENRCEYQFKRPGCADKTRILEHDDQTPPKFWCHKPQP